MYYLSACLIAKNEGRYLPEWLCFHRLMGIEHFYIFDNNSTDNTLEILRPSIDAGWVTYIPWKAHPGQLLAYDYAVKSFQNETKWMAFIDADEFLYGVETEDLKEVVSEFEEFSGLAAFWKIFGDSHHEKRPEGLVIANYTWRAPDHFLPNGHPKSIVKMDEALHPKNPHFFITKKNTVKEDKAIIAPHLPTPQKQWSYKKIDVNHYFTKSAQDSLEKRNRGLATVSSDDPRFIRSQAIFTSHNRNDIKDETLARYAERINNMIAA